MNTNQVTTYLKYANLQMAAEAVYGLESAEPGTTRSFSTINQTHLTDGNGRSSKFTDVQAQEFRDDWTVVEHISNTKTGFSGTLFKCLRDDEARGLKKDELVMSMRSTEFIDDAVRDSKTNEMEVKQFGWAFGQIADMVAWHESLRASGKIGFADQVTVTGYSLGGHLATAFNRYLAEQGQGGRISATYTFNGAGVGESKGQNTFSMALNVFTTHRVTGGNVDYFTDSVANTLYTSVSNMLNVPSPSSATIGQALGMVTQAKVAAAALPPTAATAERLKQMDFLYDAVSRVSQVNGEAERVKAGISSGGSSDPARKVEQYDIAAMKVDYQLAVLRAAELTTAFKSGILDGAGVAYAVDRAPRQYFGVSPIFDIYGAPLPSAVSNSQIHYGAPQPIYIEDQPLFRDNYPGVVAWNSLRYGEVKLLNSGFNNKDFGDTHSLVLLVDSLSVQDSLARMDADISRSTINQIFKAATNLKGDADAGQGKAEADLLENLAASLGKMLGADKQSGWTQLKANPNGGTWADVGQEGDYTGREQLQKNIQLINNLIETKQLAGKVSIKASDSSLAGLARDDFGALVSLIALSPLAITAKGEANRTSVEVALGTDDLSSVLSAWKVDKDLSKEEKAAGKQTYTDRWMQDRAAMTAAVGRYNTANATDDWLPGMTAGNTVQTNYEDKQAKVTLADGNKSLPKRFIKFGDTAADTMLGEIMDDALYGGKGDDVLKGQGGNDYLEGNEGTDSLEGGDGKDILVGGTGIDTLKGGLGADTLKGGAEVDIYKFESGFGHDTIIDADGKGKIEVVGVGNGKLDGSDAKAVAGRQGSWQSSDLKVSYNVVNLGSSQSAFPTGLLITFADKPNDTILIEGWSSSKNLGISFDATPEAPKPDLATHIGDYQKEIEQGQVPTGTATFFL